MAPFPADFTDRIRDLERRLRDVEGRTRMRTPTPDPTHDSSGGGIRIGAGLLYEDGGHLHWQGPDGTSTPLTGPLRQPEE